MFIARWTMPKCRNIALPRRHHSPSLVAGPKLAPHASCTPFGACQRPAPNASINAKTAQFAAISPRVTGVSRGLLRISAVRLGTEESLAVGLIGSGHYPGPSAVG